MSTESRYRRLLRLLPVWFREQYAEEMVEVHLAAHPGPDTRPDASEILATAHLALTTRFRAVGRPSRATLWLVAIAACALLAMSALWRLALVVGSELATPTAWTVAPNGGLIASRPWDPSDIFGSGLYELVWVGVFVLLLVGHRRAALAAGVLVALIDLSAVLGPLVAPITNPGALPLALTDARAAVLPLAAVGALALARGSVGAIPPARQRLAAAGVVAAALAALVGLRFLVSPLLLFWGGPSNWAALAVGLVAAAVVVLVAGRRLDPAWPAAVLTLALVALIAGPLPDGPGFIADLETRSLAVGMSAAAVAVVLAAIAWLRASDHYLTAYTTAGHPDQLGLAS